MFGIPAGAITGEIASLSTIVITIIVSFLLGAAICCTYMFINRKEQYSQNFLTTIVMIPAIIAIIILLVGNNVARAFSLAGAFSIIRFRSAPGTAKDITFIFLALAAGLGCGVGLLLYSVLLVIMLCVFVIILDLIKFGRPRKMRYLLKITIPEDLNFKGVFDDILDKYTASYSLIRVKTIDLGTLYQLIYDITIDNDINEKEFIDKLRCRNGNLNIVLALGAEIEAKSI